ANDFGKLELIGKSLTFEEPDHESFKSIRLSYKALDTGGTMPAVLNASNEAAVNLFLNRKIRFLDIQDLVEQCMKGHKTIQNATLNDILNAETWAKEAVHKLLN
ncbi:MAG TPA: 1-deoxy-D-xylulose-5-phosphate reductoisomerase, partial [Lachnospiraceae bacterium]|nr:1-deoxy-D-xylulose-5-phosphate reductoisomerase [Lachnospiraceae bacterium]